MLEGVKIRGYINHIRKSDVIVPAAVSTEKLQLLLDIKVRASKEKGLIALLV